MKQQITHDNHYVPQWYQRGFLAKGRHKLHILNMHPEETKLPNGGVVVEKEIDETGPKLAFMVEDLYTTHFGHHPNDDIETYLFGRIDKIGADAVRAWISGDQVRIHRNFQNFFEYMDAQKLRTPKGLDWILKHYNALPQLELMRQMQELRQMHATMWSECVREIVTASKSSVKFLVSDHPVTTYHPTLDPRTADCQYPGDPAVELVGSQFIFALDANHCLILTHIEYAENPAKVDLLSRRTNARFRGQSMARTDAFIRGRELSELEVHAINLVLKSRAKKYVAASNPAWLYPEQHCQLQWADIAKTLLPTKGLSNFGGEIFIGYKDGTSAYRDRFGRASRAHEALAKMPPNKELEVDHLCGCGSGVAYGDCCIGVAKHKRPSWNVFSIRERNLILIREIQRVLGVTEETEWVDVRRNFSDDQVRKMHELFGVLWPTDTQLIELLPRPQVNRSRALYLGMTNARYIGKIIGMLAYVDELILVHPFVNPNGVKPEFSPVVHPEKYREQTLRNVFSLLLLEPYIRSGRVHLIPDPIDYDAGFREEIKSISTKVSDAMKIGPIDEDLAEEMSREEMMRVIKRLPPSEMKSFIKNKLLDGSKDIPDASIDLVVQQWKRELEVDPLALLDPPSVGGELKMLKSFGRETGLFVASLTGSFIFADSDTGWNWLHMTDGVHVYEQDPVAQTAIHRISELPVELQTLTFQRKSESPAADQVRFLLRDFSTALLSGGQLPVLAQLADAAASPNDEEGLMSFSMHASVPLGGFQRTDVTRLVMTFGRLDDVVPVHLGIFLRPMVSATEDDALEEKTKSSPA